ncbi:MAG: LTA synthase family protein [Lachnospiraceae bacterium]
MPINNGVASESRTVDEKNEIVQKFKGNGLYLKQINLYFGNNYYGKSEGNLIITLKNEEGEQIKKMIVPAKEVQNLNYLTFKVEKRMKRAKIYSIFITGSEIEIGQGPILYRVSKVNAPNEQLTQNGKKMKGSLYAFYVYPSKGIIQMIGLIFILALLGFIGSIYIPSNKKYDNSELSSNWNVVANFLFFAVPLFGFYMVEHFTKNSWSTIYPLSILFNIIIYYCIFGAIYFIFGNKKITTILYLTLAYIIGAANYFVLSFRGTPILPSDIASMGTAKNVASNYSYTITIEFISNLIILLYICTIICKNKKFKYVNIRARAIVLPFIIVGILINFGFIKQEKFLENYDIKVNVWNQKKGYTKNGTVFGFAMNCKYLSVKKPEGYSIKEVQKIANNYMYEEEPEGKIQDKKPNIIVIMNEAFSDLSVIHSFKTNKKYMPFIDGLKENTIRGQLYVSVFGGNTCNTEMEFLTGNTMAFLPNGSIGYTQFIKEKLPGFTSTLKNQGYTGNYALHPYIADGWNRPNVYKWLGFESFISQDDFENPKLIRNYISDESNFEKVIELYEKSEKEDPFYLFNVTMQNHGGYTSNFDNFKTDVKITDENGNKQANQYLSLIRKTDEAFKKLVKYFETVKEPTILVMFGDHQPSINDEFYEKLYGKKLSDLTQEELQKKYQTPYIVWANYDIREEKRDMSANYLSSFLLELAGLEMSGYDRFLLDLQKKIPVLNAVGYIGDDGKHYTFDEDSPYKNDILKYQILQYNNLIDTKHRYEKFFD